MNVHIWTDLRQLRKDPHMYVCMYVCKVHTHAYAHARTHGGKRVVLSDRVVSCVTLGFACVFHMRAVCRALEYSRVHSPPPCCTQTLGNRRLLGSSHREFTAHSTQVCNSLYIHIVHTYITVDMYIYIYVECISK